MTMDKPLIPEYGQSTLAEVLPSVACAMGAPGTWTNRWVFPKHPDMWCFW